MKQIQIIKVETKQTQTKQCYVIINPGPVICSKKQFITVAIGPGIFVKHLQGKS